MRVLFTLPGLHRKNRGAEIVFISIAKELSRLGDSVTLIGSGQCGDATPYRFLQAASVPRERFERFPFGPILRHEYAYEELTFSLGLLRRYHPDDYDVTVTCSYPFTNWILRRPVFGGLRTPHVFVTQNGDWPATARNSEFRFFGCEGLICTNPDYYERSKNRWRCRLIPNGVDCSQFHPGQSDRPTFGLPGDRFIVLIVSALAASKNVETGLRAVSLLPDAYLVVAGDGPLRQSLDDLAAEILPGRFTRLSIRPDQMPVLYRSVDAFLHLSKDEPFGNVYLEAMATGLPIVAPDSSRSRWIVGDEEFLFQKDSPTDIATMLLAAGQSPTQYRNNRVDRAGRFAWSKVAQMYRQFLTEIVELRDKKA
jgi:glycosyltransferase involved in cell wall biosynthesis